MDKGTHDDDLHQCPQPWPGLRSQPPGHTLRSSWGILYGSCNGIRQDMRIFIFTDDADATRRSIARRIASALDTQTGVVYAVKHLLERSHAHKPTSHPQ